MSQLALIITRGVCVVTLIVASNVSLLAVQKRTVQPKSTQKVSSDEIVDKLKRATQEMLDAVARYADEEGRVLTKDELLNALFRASPGPAEN